MLNLMYFKKFHWGPQSALSPENQDFDGFMTANGMIIFRGCKSVFNWKAIRCKYKVYYYGLTQ